MQWFNQILASTLPAVPKPIVRKISNRYIAGETLSESLRVIERLNQGGMMATLDILGEFVNDAEEAKRAGEHYIEALQEINRAGFDSNVSIKLTQMGLLLDQDLCFTITKSVLDEATRLKNSVRLDMEDSLCTDATLEIFRRLRAEQSNIGCVIQAYLKRSQADIDELSKAKHNVRLCKGIYVEPPEIAYKDPLEINANYLKLLETLFAGGSYVGIATHDERLVEGAYKLIEKYGLTTDQYEFQMLLGVTEKLRDSILERGHRLRVYVPFGSHWYAYSLRRLKENPQIAGYVLKGMFTG